MSTKVNKTGATQAELFAHTLGEKQATEAKQKAETVKGLDDATRKTLRHEEDVQKKMLLGREEEWLMDFEQIAQASERMYDNATTMCDMWLLTASSYKKFVDLIIEVQKEQSRMMKRKAMADVEAENNKNKKR